VQSSGVAILSLYDEYYDYRGQETDLVLRDTFQVSLRDFAPTVSGCMGCFLPRVDLSNARIYQTSTGALFTLRFTSEGETLGTRGRTAWPL